MSLGADALTTVDKAELYLDRTGGIGSDEQYDYDFIEILVSSISAAAQRYMGRQLMPSETGSKKFRYNGGGYLSLEPYELRTLTSITLYSDMPTSTQVILAPQSGTAQSDYRLQPPQKTVLGTYLWISMPVFDPSRLWGNTGGNAQVDAETTDREVTIVGDWGAGTVPADVELAVLMGVAHMYRNSSGFSSVDLGADSYTEEAGPEADPFALPRAARALLAPFKR